MAKRGASLAINYFDNTAAALDTLSTVESLTPGARLYQKDVSNYSQANEMVDEVVRDFGKIDVLVNCAGIYSEKPVAELTEEDWDKTIAVDLKAVFNVCKFASIKMSARRYGKIVNIGSFAGKRGSRLHAHYAAAKAGVLGFTRSLARELAPFGITVNAVNPGRIRTEMIERYSATHAERWKSDTPLGRLGEPSDVAHVVVFLASRDADYITGETIEVNGGLLMD